MRKVRLYRENIKKRDHQLKLKKMWLWFQVKLEDKIMYKWT